MEAGNSTACARSFFAKNSSHCYDLPYYFIAFSYGTNVFLGSPAHCCILWLSFKEAVQGQPLDVFVFSTSLTDVFFNFGFPFIIKQYFFSCASCRYVTVIVALVMMVGRPLFQTFTCVERYVAVLHPVSFLKFKANRYRISVSIVGWLLTVSSALLVAVGTVTYNLLFLVEYPLFLLIKGFTCLMVLKALKRPGPGREKGNRDKIKAFRIIQIVLASSLLMYAPVVFSLILSFFLDEDTFLLYWSFALCLGIMTGFVQPCLYLKRIKKKVFVLPKVFIK